MHMGPNESTINIALSFEIPFCRWLGTGFRVVVRVSLLSLNPLVTLLRCIVYIKRGYRYDRLGVD